MRPRVVIDTDVLFEGFERMVRDMHGHPFLDVLDHGVNDDYLALWSSETLRELKWMLYHSAKAKKYDFHLWHPEDVLDILVIAGERVQITGCTYDVGPDRDDDKFVETAIVGKAEYLVADDYRHFHHPDVTALLLAHGCTVVRASEFLDVMRQLV